MPEFSPLAPLVGRSPSGDRPLLHKLFASVDRPAEQHRIVPTETLGNVHTISFSASPPEDLSDEHVFCAFLDDGFLLADRTDRASCVVLVDIVREIARRVPRSTAIRQTSLNLTSIARPPRSIFLGLRTYASLTSSFTFLVTRYSVIKLYGFLICDIFN